MSNELSSRDYRVMSEHPILGWEGPMPQRSEPSRLGVRARRARRCYAGWMFAVTLVTALGPTRVHAQTQDSTPTASSQAPLAPGEERPVTIPASGAGAAFVTVIRTSAGFRPSDVDLHSEDRRYLGVFVVMPEHAVR